MEDIEIAKSKVKVYISRSLEDKGLADQIAQALRSRGFDVHVERRDIGKTWQHEATQALLGSELIILLITQAYIDGRWTMHEAKLAAARHRAGLCDVFPVVRLDKVRIPDCIRHIYALQAASLEADAIAERLDIAWYDAHPLLEDSSSERRQSNVGKANEVLQAKISELELRSRRYLLASIILYVVGGIVLTIGVGFGIYRAELISDGEFMKDSGSEISVLWMMLIEYSLVNLVALGLLVGASRYAFVLGRTCMQESMRLSDRRHAISFGQLYLQTRVGGDFEWLELKDVFQNWNMSAGEGYPHIGADEYDPKTASQLAELVRTAFERGREESKKK